MPCGGKIYTTESACKAAFGGGKCCWAEVGTDIWCYNPLPRTLQMLMPSY
jgi:hypothetical protein